MPNSIEFLIAEFLQADYKVLLNFWLADQVTAVVADEKDLSNEVLNIVKKEYCCPVFFLNTSVIY